MKTIFMGLFSIFMLVNIGYSQETKTLTATFDGYEEGIYYFSEGENDFYDFGKINAEVLKKFDLNSEEYHNKKFKITYKEETIINEDDDEYEVWTIVKLELVK